MLTRTRRRWRGRSQGGRSRASRTPASLLRETNPDMVSIVVPTQLHEEVALQCIAAGANVLVEKPIAANLDAARRIAAAAEQAGLVLTVGHIERFNPAIQELKRRLEAGQGGPVLQVRARRVGPFPHRIRDVGVIHDLGPHDIDIMRYLLGDEIERVYAESRSHIATGNEDMFAGLVRFRGGAMGTLDINWLTPTKERSLTVLCEKGMFVVDYAAQSLAFYENFDAAAREGRLRERDRRPDDALPDPEPRTASGGAGSVPRRGAGGRAGAGERARRHDRARGGGGAGALRRNGDAGAGAAGHQRVMNVAVVGIGRIGLPVAATIASKGHRVFGCDVNAALVERVNRGENPIPDEAGLDAMLKQVVASGAFSATNGDGEGGGRVPGGAVRRARRCRRERPGGLAVPVRRRGRGGQGVAAGRALHLRYDPAGGHDQAGTGAAARGGRAKAGARLPRGVQPRALADGTRD
ncbi:MAG: Gfo/Idh/MocA family oxidoreductase [Chitinophagaceae bacterium]